MPTEKKEQLHPIRDKSRNNFNIRMQSDKSIYILTGLTLNQNFQESQRRMQMHIYCAQMIGWNPIALKKVYGYRDFAFTFDENTETIDSYLIRIRQVANLLGYGEPQILEVFKNTLPTKLYWVLFSIEDLRQAVDTAKRILTKEKLDKQLTGQTSTSPFISIGEGTDKRVSFNAKDELGDKVDKLTIVMSKLAATDSHERRPFKLQIYKSRGQNRSYGQGRYQPRSNDRNRSYGTDRDTRQNY